MSINVIQPLVVPWLVCVCVVVYVWGGVWCCVWVMALACSEGLRLREPFEIHADISEAMTSVLVVSFFLLYSSHSCDREAIGGHKTRCLQHEALQNITHRPSQYYESHIYVYNI